MSTPETTLRVPTLHLNGSGYDNLFEQYASAAGAIRAAIKAMPCPHGRDYYVQEDIAYSEARAQFEDRIARLRELEREMQEILEALADQRDARRR